MAFVRILFLADLAFISLNLSKSLSELLLFLACIRLAQDDAAHFPEMSSDFHALLTTRDRAENGNLALRVVRWRPLMGNSCLGTSEQGPSMRTRFWSMTSTMAAILPADGPD